MNFRSNGLPGTGPTISPRPKKPRSPPGPAAPGWLNGPAMVFSGSTVLRRSDLLAIVSSSSFDPNLGQDNTQLGVGLQVQI